MAKCKSCKSEFHQYNKLQNLCVNCAIKKGKEKVKKDWRIEKKERKEALLSHKDWLKMLQVLVNTYVRLRDKNQNCISCDKPLKGKYDAGHYFSVGAYPNLRFDLNNIHAQCVHCNRHKHSNANEYTLRLPSRIGQDAFNDLTERRNEPLKLSIPEIKKMIADYKAKIKKLKNN